ncbi:hypothetical protein ACFVVU_09300 [Kitasatospora sp. NPDC057965]|uniref:hypothetical protein n=1 Tax=Kitasatospora sp. NPDC057965 TaxID=3346291 RepID=UPI0036DDA227
MKHTARALTLTAALLATAGCASSGTVKNPAPIAMPDPIPTATQATLAAVARTYQDAANRGDWQAACALSSASLRGGSTADCVTARTSTPPPATTPAPGTLDGPGPAAAGAVIRMPQGPGSHPAGYGVYITFTLDPSGKVGRRALRLVDEDGAWVVDQSEDGIFGESQLRRVLLRS